MIKGYDARPIRYILAALAVVVLLCLVAVVLLIAGICSTIVL